MAPFTLPRSRRLRLDGMPATCVNHRRRSHVVQLSDPGFAHPNPNGGWQPKGRAMTLARTPETAAIAPEQS